MLHNRFRLSGLIWLPAFKIRAEGESNWKEREIDILERNGKRYQNVSGR
jgi:hypothetical protein